MSLADEVPTGDRVVRSFLVTGGKAKVEDARELELESIVSRTDLGAAQCRSLSFERRSIVERAGDPLSIAELSAHLGLPMLSTVLLASQLAHQGFLEAHEVVEEVNMDSLVLIRRALLNLGAK